MKSIGDSARAPWAVNNAAFGSSPSARHGERHDQAALARHVSNEQFFLAQLPVVERVTARICRRDHLRDTEAEDFASEVKLHLIQNDYEVLRRFQGRSSIQTYLTVVIQRLFVNYRNRIWGRWRPSADAVRLGPLAILLERLVSRDGWSFEEAQEQMRANHGVAQTREALYALWTGLSPSAARRFVPEDAAAEVPSAEPSPDDNVLRAERNFVRHRVRAALDRARRALTAEERLLVRMQYDDGYTINEVAITLHMKPKPLYRTFERLRARLKASLIADGVSASDVRMLFASSSESSSSATPMDREPAPAPVVPFSRRKREGVSD